MIHHQFSTDQLPHETKIWRYMDLVGAVDLLSNKRIRFTQLKQFEDGFEGRTSEAEREEKRKQEEAEGLSTSHHNSMTEFTETINRELTFASCWTLNHPQNMLMWSIYAPDKHSVAVETTVGKLIESAGYEQPEILIGRTSYGDRITGINNWFNQFAAVWSKWNYYEHENEVRLITNTLSMSAVPELANINSSDKHIYLPMAANPIQKIYASPRMSEDSFKTISGIIRRTESGLELSLSGIHLNP